MARLQLREPLSKEEIKFIRDTLKGEDSTFVGYLKINGIYFELFNQFFTTQKGFEFYSSNGDGTVMKWSDIYSFEFISSSEFDKCRKDINTE